MVSWRWLAPCSWPACLAVAGAVLAAAQLPAQSTLSGRIMDARTARFIAGARVELRRNDSAATVFTDSMGAYSFAPLPAATYELRASDVLHAERRLWVVVGSRSQLRLDVPLEPLTDSARRAPVPLAPLVTLGNARAGDSLLLSSRIDGAVRDLRAPWRQQDPRNAAAGARGGSTLAPGAASEPGLILAPPTHTLFVWAPGDSRGRVTLDGILLDVPLQVGEILPPVDGSMLASVALEPAGASPEFNGGLDYTLDLRTRAPARASRTWGELDPLFVRAGVDVPAGRASVEANARHVNGGITEWMSGKPFDYGYSDLIVRGDVPAGTGGVTATLLATTEGVTVPRDQGTDDAVWGNLAGALAWTGGSDMDHRSARLTLGRGREQLPLLSLFSGRTTTTADRSTANVERIVRSAAWVQALGADAALFRLGEETRGTPSPACADSAECWHTRATTAGAFDEWRRSVGARVWFTAGARVEMDQLSGAERFDLLPRTSITIDAGHHTVVGGSVGRYSQIVTYQPLDTAAALGSATSSVAAERSPSLVLARSTQAELGAQWSSGHMAFSAAGGISRHDADSSDLAGTVRSVDVAYRWSSPRLTAAMAYSALFPVARVEGPRRDVVSGSVSALVGRLRGTLSLTYAAGLPYTRIVLTSAGEVPDIAGSADTLSAVPTRPVLRLDANVRSRWNVKIGGRTLSLEPDASIRNLLNRSDAAFYYRGSTGTGGVHAIGALPLLASVGIVWDAGSPSGEKP